MKSISTSAFPSTPSDAKDRTVSSETDQDSDTSKPAQAASRRADKALRESAPATSVGGRRSRDRAVPHRYRSAITEDGEQALEDAVQLLRALDCMTAALIERDPQSVLPAASCAVIARLALERVRGASTGLETMPDTVLREWERELQRWSA